MSPIKRTAAEVYRDGPRELCHCHGKPMYWHASDIHRGGGRWRCAVGHRRTVRERLRDPEVRARAQEGTRERTLLRLAERRSLIAAELIRRGGVCVGCGSAGPLHWHHRDPTRKSFPISQVTRSHDDMARELSKCDPLCAACHARAHIELRRQT